jgi:hypothetical protein
MSLIKLIVAKPKIEMDIASIAAKKLKPKDIE